ncbi:HEAT repeat domain-containing protein [Oxynema aestuarii]|jgi:HEAT repeat protein|uniref:MFS transporter n=1 Tax=Oxynema aestuarii AP17 TaxID=2064643 RepID=A0A6H1U0Q5_9CYAN|nr:HEAT repeat domain-containing protein [Oxynema aestuarii]QIZ71199.1 MFS transporter [Oxynema aestuarii AP17]RMH73015.1 MAG: MFS transporter [Cyanobacteria bacterium J007]
MELKDRQSTKSRVAQGLLQWVNLRPEEGERTWLMFAFYTLTSVGLLWLEASTVGLFLDEYGASSLPWIYIAGAAIGSSLGFLYSWLQKILPLRRAIVAIACLMAAPLLLFRVGLAVAAVASITVFLMRLWMDASYVLNDLNTSITANQLFNIREIKRTYPIISSGILLADVISGFSLPALIEFVGLKNVTLMSCAMMGLGAFILFYLSQSYQQAFPDAPRRRLQENQQDYTNRRLAGPLKQYAIPLFAFFILAEALYLLVDFQFLSELEQQAPEGQSLAIGIASFLGLFNGVLGIFELAMQWFVSSRLIERVGVFAAAMILPGCLCAIGLVSLTQLLPFFWGLVALKFIEELLQYTLIEGTGPVLFQPLPDSIRSNIQAMVNGIAEPISTGVAGLMILTTIALCNFFLPDASAQEQTDIQGLFFVLAIVLLGLGWLFVVWILRSRYLGLLVSSAERGRFGVSDVDMRAFKRTIVETLEQSGREEDKRSCIELLTQIDPENVGDVLAPLLVNLTPALQRQSLEEMLRRPNPTYKNYVEQLVERPSSTEVLALALRYIWLTEADLDIETLRPYLDSAVDPVVRGTAASLIMRRGNREQKAEATNTLRRMLTNKDEQERIMGCRALGEADYLQGLRLYIPNLLQDESLRVRCALLEVIAATRFEEYYPSLLRGLYYKSTRDSAMRALVRLDNEIIDRLVALAEDIHKPDLVRMHAWMALGQIGTIEALDSLIGHLIASWGTTRRNILRILLKMPRESGIEGVLDRLGRSGVEMLIDQELMFMGQIYATLNDLTKDRVRGREAKLLRSALHDLIADAIDRLFLLMKFLYPFGSIQAAAFNLKSGVRSNMARGLEILDNTLDIPSKRIVLSVLDRHSDLEKLQTLSDLFAYETMSPSDRLRRLVEYRYFLSDWPLACCFHLARASRWSLTAEQTLACLRHPKGFVREAVLAYLRVASPRALAELLPMMIDDPDRLVAAQVKQMMAELGLSDTHSRPRTAPSRQPNLPNYRGIAGFEAT